jgi:hypothetical protein
MKLYLKLKIYKFIRSSPILIKLMIYVSFGVMMFSCTSLLISSNFEAIQVKNTNYRGSSFIYLFNVAKDLKSVLFLKTLQNCPKNKRGFF